MIDTQSSYINVPSGGRFKTEIIGINGIIFAP
jgi:hypothetical protein